MKKPLYFLQDFRVMSRVKIYLNVFQLCVKLIRITDSVRIFERKSLFFTYFLLNSATVPNYPHIMKMLFHFFQLRFL
jgi:hypothetical protein